MRGGQLRRIESDTGLLLSVSVEAISYRLEEGKVRLFGPERARQLEHKRQKLRIFTKMVRRRHSLVCFISTNYC
jgi:hypothetical protein